MTDPLARYLQPNWAQAPDDEDDGDPLRKYLNPNWMNQAQPVDFDQRLTTARGRRTVEAEAIGRQIETLERVLPAAQGERKKRLEMQLERLRREASPFAGAETVKESGRRFIGGVAGGIPKMFTLGMDLIAAGGQQTIERALNATGATRLLPQGARQPFTRIRQHLWETEAGLDEMTGARGWEGLAGSFVTPFGSAGAGHVLRNVPIVGKAFRVANAPAHMYAELSNETLRFLGKAKMLEGAARAGLEGSRAARMAGSVIGDLPANVLQAFTIPDGDFEDAIKALAFGTAGAAAGGLLSGKVPFDRPRAPDMGDFSKPGPKGPVDSGAGELADQARRVNNWQKANPDKVWTDLSAEEQAIILGTAMPAGFGTKAPGTAVVPAGTAEGGRGTHRLGTAAKTLRDFILGNSNDYVAAKAAYQDLAEAGLDSRAMASVLGLEIVPQQGGAVMVGRDGLAPAPERLMLASGQAPPAVESAAMRQMEALQERLARMEAMQTRLREQNRALNQERRRLKREAETDGLVEGMQNQRAWENVREQFNNDPNTWISKFDINNFKTQVNDVFGHEVGNQAIRNVGKVVLANAQHYNLRAFRIGGDEFVLAGPKGALLKARNDIEAQLFGFEVNGNKISISGGVGHTFDSAEKNLNPRKRAAKQRLGQSLTRPTEDQQLNALRELSDQDFLVRWQAAADQNSEFLDQFTALGRERGLQLNSELDIGLTGAVWEGMKDRVLTPQEISYKIKLLQHAPEDVVRGFDAVLAQATDPILRENLEAIGRTLRGEHATMPGSPRETGRENTISPQPTQTPMPATIGPQTGELKLLPSPKTANRETFEVDTPNGTLEFYVPHGKANPHVVAAVAYELENLINLGIPFQAPPQTKVFLSAVMAAELDGILDPQTIHLINTRGDLRPLTGKQLDDLAEVMKQTHSTLSSMGVIPRTTPIEMPTRLTHENRPPVIFTDGNMKHVLTQEPATGAWRVSFFMNDTPVGHAILHGIKTFDDATQVLRDAGYHPISQHAGTQILRSRWEDAMQKMRTAEFYTPEWKAAQKEALGAFDELLEMGALTKADFMLHPKNVAKPPTVDELRSRLEGLPKQPTMEPRTYQEWQQRIDDITDDIARVIGEDAVLKMDPTGPPPSGVSKAKMDQLRQAYEMRDLVGHADDVEAMRSVKVPDGPVNKGVVQQELLTIAEVIRNNPDIPVTEADIRRLLADKTFTHIFDRLSVDDHTMIDTVEDIARLSPDKRKIFSDAHNQFVKAAQDAGLLPRTEGGTEARSLLSHPESQPRPAIAPEARSEPVLETIRPRKSLLSMSRDELVSLMDDIIDSTERANITSGTQFDAAMRDIQTIQTRLKEFAGRPLESATALDKPVSEDRLTDLMSRTLDKLNDKEIRELNTLLQNHNAKLPSGDPRKGPIVDKILELRDHQAALEEKAKLSRRKSKEEHKPRGGMQKGGKKGKAGDSSAPGPKNPEAGFTLPETQVALASTGVGFVLGMAMPADNEQDRLRNAFLGALITGGSVTAGIGSRTYLRNRQAQAAPKIPGQDSIDGAMKSTFNLNVEEGITPDKMVGRIVGSLERFYQKTLRPSHTGELVSRLLAQGQKVGMEVADMLSTFGFNKRMTVEWVFHGPKVFGPDGNPTRRMTVRSDGSAVPIYSAAEILHMVDGDMEHLGRTAMALSALEQYSKTGKMPHPSLDPVKLGTYLANIDAKYVEAARHMRDLHLGLLDLLGEAGIITPETRSKLATEKFYTTMERVFQNEYDAIGRNIAAKIKGIFSPNPVKARKGPSELKIRNPFESMMLMIPRVMKAVELQEKKGALISLWEASNIPDEVKQSFMRPMTRTQKDVSPDRAEKLRVMKESMPELTADEATRLLDAYDPSPLGPKSDFMTYIRDGKTEVWRLAPDLVDTFAYMQGFEIEKIWKFLGIGSNLARQGTALSPDFVGRIAWFDVFQSFLNSKHGDLRSFLPGVNYVDALYKIWQKSPEYLNFMGGAAEATMLEGIHRPRDMIRRAQAVGDTYTATIWKEVTELHPIDAYKTLLTPFAEAGRFSEFLASRRHGASVHEAHRAAAAVGGYYNQAGQYLNGLFSAVPFMRGVAQSIDQTVYAAGLHPFRQYDNQRTAKAIRWFTRGITAISAATAAIYAANADDEEINSIRRSENGQRMWFLRNPVTGGIMAVRKPAGPEGAFFGGLVEAALDDWRNKDPDAWRRWVQYMRNEVQLPWLPPIVQAAGTIGTGVDLSFGSPLISERVQGLPTGMMANPNTSNTAQTMSTGLTRTLGEPSSPIGERLFSPAGIEYIARAFGGSLAQESFKLSDIARQWVEEGNVPVAQEWPIVRKFVSVDMTRQQTGEIEDFYRYARRAEKISRGLSESERTGDLEGYMAIMERYGHEVPAAAMLMQSRNNIMDSFRAIRELREMPGDSRMKRDLIRELRRNITVQAGIAVDMYRSTTP